MCYIRQREREQENKRKKKKRRIICIRQTSAGAKKGGQVRGGRLGASCGKRKKVGYECNFHARPQNKFIQRPHFSSKWTLSDFFSLSLWWAASHNNKKMFDRICIYMYIYPSPSILFLCVCVCGGMDFNTHSSVCVCLVISQTLLKTLL